MIRTKTIDGSDKIHAALNKLKEESNAQELELIELVTSIYEKVKEKQHAAMDKAKDSVDAVNTSVHEHPWRYIGGALVCGVLTGFLLRR